MLLCVDGYMHATSMCVCHMCICLPVMNHASAHRVRIPGLCHHTWLRYWLTSAPDVPLSCWTSPQAGPHQAATPPPTGAPHFHSHRTGFLGMTHEQQEGVGDVKTSTLIKTYWGSLERTQLPAEGTQPEGTLKAQFRDSGASQRKQTFSLLPTQGRTGQVSFCPPLPRSKKELETAFL